MYGKSRPIKNIVIDASRIDEEELELDLIHSQHDNLLWILDELNIIMDDLNSKDKDFTPAQKSKLNSVGKLLIPYFIEYSEHPNKRISSSCREGLKYMLKLFPDMKNSL